MCTRQRLYNNRNYASTRNHVHQTTARLYTYNIIPTSNVCNIIVMRVFTGIKVDSAHDYNITYAFTVIKEKI